jgi:hypothetical protein
MSIRHSSKRKQPETKSEANPKSEKELKQAGYHAKFAFRPRYYSMLYLGRKAGLKIPDYPESCKTSIPFEIEVQGYDAAKFATRDLFPGMNGIANILLSYLPIYIVIETIETSSSYCNNRKDYKYIGYDLKDAVDALNRACVFNFERDRYPVSEDTETQFLTGCGFSLATGNSHLYPSRGYHRAWCVFIHTRVQIVD